MTSEQPSKIRIFEAAEALFAERGYRATSVQAIVDAASINKRMLYHYFGSKKGLYDAVVQANFEEILGRMVIHATAAKEAYGPEVALGIAVSEYFEALLQHPRYVRFMLWEEADQWAVLNNLSHQALDRARSLIIELLYLCRDKGSLDYGIEPEFSWSFVLLTSISYFSYQPRLQLYFENDVFEPDSVSRFKAEIVRFVLHGLGVKSDLVADVLSTVLQIG